MLPFLPRLLRVHGTNAPARASPYALHLQWSRSLSSATGFNRSSSASAAKKLNKSQKISEQLSAPKVSPWTPLAATPSNASTVRAVPDLLALADPESKRLLVVGQGSIELQQMSMRAFTMTVYNSQKGVQASNLTLRVDEKEVMLSLQVENSPPCILQYSDSEPAILRQCEGPVPSTYWLSLSDEHQCIKYGVGEVRELLKILEFEYTRDSDVDRDIADLVDNADRVELRLDDEHDESGQSVRAQTVWRVHRDGVVSEPPLKIVGEDQLTMDDVHAERYTVAVNLSAACNQLYQNIRGANFVLDTPDFPAFSTAIEESIVDPNGWCHRTLKDKSTEFGKEDLEATYLRITLGKNHCNSPGVPYVMEIWPPGHHSPIHNHGNAHAVIRVLHGEIHVSLYPFLSKYYSEPFAKAVLEPGDVTYMTEGINQTHMLKNESADTTCVTIQCYQYGDADKRHYEYFDYVSNDDEQAQIKQFDPNSDEQFDKFKLLMQQEYEARRAAQ